MIKLDVTQRMYDNQYCVYAWLHRKEYESSISGRWVLIAVNRVRELAINRAKSCFANSLEFQYV